MRFIGNKENLIDKIYQIIVDKQIKGNSIFDFFSGTARVGVFFKNKDFKVFSSDLLYFSYVLQQAYIVNNKELEFKKLLPYINNINLLDFSAPLTKVVEYALPATAPT